MVGLILLLSGVIGLSAIGTLPAQADDVPQVTLQVPRPGVELSGTTEVWFSVSDVGGPVLTGATVSIGSVSSTQPLDPDWCTIACTLTSVLDVGDLPDGVAEVRMVLDLVDGRHPVSVFPVVIRNAPTVSPSYETEAGMLAADQIARVRVYVEPRDGATITGVRWQDARGATDFAPLDDPSDLSGANWQALVDTAALSEGPHRGTVVATDDAGRTSRPVTISYTVVRTVALSLVTPWGAAVDDLVLQDVDLAYRYAPAVTQARPVRATLVVDGTTVAVDRQLELREVSAADNAGIAAIDTTYRLSPGAHRVTINLTDNRGITRGLTYAVTVGATVEARWTLGAGATVVSGDLHRVIASVRTAGVDLLDCRVMVEDQRSDQPATCLRRPDGTWSAEASVQLYLDGPHTVRLRLMPSRGSVATLATTLTVVPRATATITESAATAGRPYTMAGAVRSTGRSLVGVVVDLQTRSGPKAAWTTVTTSTSSTGGRVTFSLVSPRSADYRLVTRTKRGVWGGAGGPVRFVEVTSTLTSTTTPTTVRKGKSFTVRAVTKPGDRGARIWLQRYLPAERTWVGFISATTASGGTVSLSYKPGVTSTYRLVRDHTSTTWGTVGKPFAVRVTK